MIGGHIRVAGLVALAVGCLWWSNPPQNCAAEMVAHYGQRVDTETSAYDCIACHDGLTGKEAHYCKVECDFRSPHSVFKEYPPRKQPQLYAPAASLPEKGIRLINGKVTCISCHDLKNPGPFHLAAESIDKLCFSCHLK